MYLDYGGDDQVRIYVEDYSWSIGFKPKSKPLPKGKRIAYNLGEVEITITFTKVKVYADGSDTAHTNLCSLIQKVLAANEENTTNGFEMRVARSSHTTSGAQDEWIKFDGTNDDLTWYCKNMNDIKKAVRGDGDYYEIASMTFVIAHEV